MRLYSKTHEWFDTETKEIGITNFAAEELGDIVYLSLPEINDKITAEEQFADVESVKAVAEIYSPISGILAEVNDEVLDDPGLINEDAEKYWLIRITDEKIPNGLMQEEEYRKFMEEI